MSTGVKIFLVLFSLSLCAKADVIINPESHHKLFLSHGLFFDPQSMIIFRGDSRGWAAVGGSAALVEFKDSEYKSQLVIHASANTSYEFASTGTVHVETSDARVGLAYDLQFSPTLRGAFIWTHQSGHISDNVPDIDLMGPDLGNEVFDFRVVQDFERTWRIGGGLRPFVISNPSIPAFGAEQFAEWYPNQMSTDPHELCPFVALGLEEYGAKTVDLTAHLQVGYVAGSHFDQHNLQSMRFTLGVYSGADPRLKYFQFKNRRVDFVYAGFSFEM